MRTAIADAAVTSQFTAADTMVPSIQAAAIEVAATEAAADTVEVADITVAAATTAKPSEINEESPANAGLSGQGNVVRTTAPIATSTRANTKLPSKKNQRISATQSP